MAPDALAALADLPDVRAASDAARSAVDALLWRRDVRGAAAAVAAASQARGAQASAAIEGADVSVVDDSPMGRVLAAAQRVTVEVPSLVDTFGTAPLQVLARLHALAAPGFDDAPGRPREHDAPDDALHLGDVVPSAGVPPRLALLAQMLTSPTSAPALVVAAVAHGELMTLRPFAWGSGLVARATVRLVLAGRGVDPSLFSIPETGIATLGRPAYVRALRSFASGTPQGVADYLVWHATAVAAGAQAVVVPE